MLVRKTGLNHDFMNTLLLLNLDGLFSQTLKSRFIFGRLDAKMLILSQWWDLTRYRCIYSNIQILMLQKTTKAVFKTTSPTTGLWMYVEEFGLSSICVGVGLGVAWGYFMGLCRWCFWIWGWKTNEFGLILHHHPPAHPFISSLPLLSLHH